MIAIKIHAQWQSSLEALMADAGQVFQSAKGVLMCSWSQAIPVCLEVHRR